MPGKIIHTWGGRGEGDGQFLLPSDVAVAKDGTIVVADGYTNRIQCFHQDGTFLRKWGSEGEGEGQFRLASGLDIGIHDADNSYLTAIMLVPEVGAFPPGVMPICMAYLCEEYVFVVDRGNHRMQVFEMDGTFRRKWGREGSGDGEFNQPCKCCVHRDVVYVSELENNRIQLFHHDGIFIRKWGNFGVFGSPGAIAVSPTTGLVYIVDNLRVSCYHNDGILAPNWISPPNLKYIEAVEADDDGVFIVHSRNILQCRGNGSFLQYVIPMYDNPLGYPVSMAKTTNGMLYVVDCDHAKVFAIQL